MNILMMSFNSDSDKYCIPNANITLNVRVLTGVTLRIKPMAGEL